MAKVDKYSLLASVQGSLGQMVIVHRNGKVWTRSKPTVITKGTASQKAHREKLGQAAKWSSQLPKHAPDVAALYRAAAKGTDWSWQNMAIADYLHGPVIEGIDLSGYTGLSGERIRVQARDDVPKPMKLGVADVRVVVRNLAGSVLEQGNAAPDGTAWVYVTRTELPPAQIVQIEVMASDQPNNHATSTVPHLTRDAK